MGRKSLVGNPEVRRKEAVAKLTGAARYVDDVSFADLLHGVTVRSPAPRGRITGIRFEPGVPWDEVVVVTAKDILPGRNAIHLILDDQPCLADAGFEHAEEAVVLLAHPDKALCERARTLVKIDFEPLPALLSIDDALAAGADGLFKEYWIRKGDVDAAGAAHAWIEGVYETGAQEQLYIEPNGVIAECHPGGGGVTVWGSLQCPYYVQKALIPLLDLPPEKTRIVQLETGGGFGGKEEYPSMIAAHAALLSQKAGGRRVKIVYDRAEDMVATTKRHPSRTRVRVAARADGTIDALDIDFVIDGGAYATLSQVVLSRGTIHAAGPYAIANVRVRGRALRTHTPPHGAFRGFGAPQSIFALERHLDVVAARLGLSPIELRRRNFVKKGGTLSTGQIVRDDVDLDALLDQALREAGWDEKKARHAAASEGHVRHGLGVATFLHGTGFTGSGEKFLASVVGVEGTAAGRVRVLAASTEIGQGTSTIFAQIAGDALGVDYDAIDIAQPDTADVPNSGPTVASRTCTIVGRLVEDAARGLRQTLLASGRLREPYDTPALQAAIRAHVAEVGPLRAVVEYKQPPYIQWDEVSFVGDAYGAYSWGVYVAEVAVDTRTYEARVLDFVALQECGKVIHPLLAAGQIEGGVAQGIGWALYENVVWKDGRMANNRFTDYIIPTTVDIPPIRTFFAEAPWPYGPGGGAKGIGELPMDGPAPAIANAIADACGAAARVVPMTPERIMDDLLGEGGRVGEGGAS
jgi:CO/xanthine dehydrogenase Mo-binding subunit